MAIHRLCTSGIGWPVSLKILKCGNDFYFDCQTVIDFLGFEKQIRKQGFKFIDKFLIDNGEYTQHADAPVTDTQPDTSGEFADNEYRRRKTAYFSSHQHADVNKRMVINLTTRKMHVEVTTSSMLRCRLSDRAAAIAS